MIVRVSLFLVLVLSVTERIVAQSGVSNLDVAYIEQRYDALGNDALSPFFDPGTFRVSVRVALETARGSARGNPSAASTESTSERLPGLPFYQRGTESEIRRPATPVTPQEIGAERVILKSMTVSVWLSDQLTSRDVDFATRVIREALKLDAERGDRLSVRTESMPRRSAPAVGQTSTVVSRDSTIGAAAVRVSESTSAWWVVILVVVILGAVGFALWRFRIRKTSIVNQEPMVEELEFGRRAASAPIAMAPMVPATTSVQAAGVAGGSPSFNVGRVTMSHLDERVDSMEFLLHVFMVHAEEMARMMEAWVVRDSAAGIDRAVTVLHLVDPKFLDAFKPFMSKSVVDQLERALRAKMESIATRTAIDLMETTARDIKKRFRVEHGTVRLIALQQFDFLGHIEDSVLVKLLEGATAETCAMVLYHLESERASLILTSMPKELAEETLLMVPLVRGMEFPVYDRIATDLFDKYHEWLRSQSLVTRGLSHTVQILEALSEAFRVPYMETMSVVDPVWAMKVRQQLIAEENLEWVPERLLAPVVVGLTLDRLAVLCAVAPAALADRMVALRTSREQARLQQLRADSVDIPEHIRRRELADLVVLLRNQRALTSDLSLIE